MKKCRGIHVLVSLHLLVGCQGQSGSAPSPVQRSAEVATTSTGDIFHLSAEVLDEQAALAKNGDAEAAMRVAQHYSLGENDTRKSIPWLAIAAEKEDVIAMQNIASSLVAIGGRENCQAALEWYERAKRGMTSTEVKSYGVDESILGLKHDFNECARALAPPGSGGGQEANTLRRLQHRQRSSDGAMDHWDGWSHEAPFAYISMIALQDSQWQLAGAEGKRGRPVLRRVKQFGSRSV